MNERWIQLLQSQHAHFNMGRVTAYADADLDGNAIASAPHTKDNTEALVDLSHYGVIQVTGDDAASFLHAQLTNDVNALADGDAQWNGWCSVKGRLLVTFLIWRRGTDYFLMLPNALLPAILKRLGMFVLRAKVKLIDVSTSLMRFAVVNIMNTASNEADALHHLIANMPTADMRCCILPQGGDVIRLSAWRVVVVAEIDVAINHWQSIAPKTILSGASTWDLGNIRAGTIDITPETQDAYVPQMANFELSGGVSFKKGCYPGQEIVARTQYRGILKRRMQRVAFQCSNVPLPGTSIYSPEFPEQACGTIALAALVGARDGDEPSDSKNIEALVVAQIESLRPGSLYLDAAFTQPMTLLDLPYRVAT